MSEKKPRVLVAMSGGVDSSVAAALLVDQGYDVIGATMQVWDYSSCDIEEGNGTCCSSLDVDDARSVADRLGIPFYVLNCEAKFKTAVIDPFLKAYLEGQTPLPCVNCNTYLKFDHLIRKMKELECDYLATGHYAQIVPNEKGEARIFTSTDDWKDQTYFLFTIEPEIVKHLLFPVGHLKKPEVRKIEKEKELVVAKKKDSQGICFVGNKGYGTFIEEQVDSKILAQRAGVIRRYPSGETMAEHAGIHHFTYGQSKGLGMSHHEKLFVIKIDPETNTVWVGDENYLYRSNVDVVDAHLIDQVEDGEILEVKIRYAHKGSKARVKKTEKGFHFEFLEPQRAVTPGQAAVMYRGRQLLGGGWITL
ncbi:MAG: tRNA 2-thiouridine(34) synthase MnmA [Pseudobdellovibrionaceae bacterium]